jgi:superfamily II DNA or RNA helicase
VRPNDASDDHRFAVSPESRTQLRASPRSPGGADVAPIPRLYIFTDECTVLAHDGLRTTYETRSLPLLRLTFDWGDAVPSERVEAGYRRVLESFGALELDALDDAAPAPSVDADYTLPVEGSAHDFCAFLAETVPELRARGFRVTVSESHKFKVLSAPATFYANVARGASGAKDDARHSGAHDREGSSDDDADGASDWFSVELGLEVDGKRVPILKTLLDLLEESSSLDGLRSLFRRSRKTIAVPVCDGTYLAVPVDKIRALLRVLSELYEWQHAQDDTLHVHATRAASLVALESAFSDTDAHANGADGTGCGGDSGAQCAFRVSGDAALLARARELSGAPDASTVATPAGLRAELRPYQRAGLAWLCRLADLGAGGVLADDMGLGKTLQVIAFLCREKERASSGESSHASHARRTSNAPHVSHTSRSSHGKPALVVAPTSLVVNWAREIGKFAPHLRVAVHHGSDRNADTTTLANADVVITTYPVLVRDEEMLSQIDFGTVVLDEAQTIKNDKSRSHRSAESIRADRRFCLTGTPVENNLGELWSIFDFACPGLLGDELSFKRRFQKPIEQDKNEERLSALRQLVAPYILRRTKAEVLTELLPKTELLRPVEIRGEQRDLYESIRVAAHAEVRRLIRTKGLAASTIPILGALTKLRQVCCDPTLVSLECASDVRVSAKREAFEQMLSELLDSGRRVLVFSQFTSMLALLSKSVRKVGAAHATITGATLDRAREVDRFERGEVPVFLISLRAGGTGLTLTSADTVIHYDPWWNPAVQAQATDRAHRMGQKKQVTVHHLYVAGSVEERILRMQKRKKNVADAILGAGEATGALTESDVEMLLSPLA